MRRSLFIGYFVLAVGSWNIGSGIDFSGLFLELLFSKDFKVRDSISFEGFATDLFVLPVTSRGQSSSVAPANMP